MSYYQGPPDERESRQHYATSQVAILQRRLTEKGHAPDFQRLVLAFRQFGTLYDLGYRSESWELAA